MKTKNNKSVRTRMEGKRKSKWSQRDPVQLTLTGCLAGYIFPLVSGFSLSQFESTKGQKNKKKISVQFDGCCCCETVEMEGDKQNTRNNNKSQQDEEKTLSYCIIGAHRQHQQDTQSETTQQTSFDMKQKKRQQCKQHSQLNTTPEMLPLIMLYLMRSKVKMIQSLRGWGVWWWWR